MVWTLAQLGSSVGLGVMKPQEHCQKWLQRTNTSWIVYWGDREISKKKGGGWGYIMRATLQAFHPKSF